ncbi:mediator of RNA polymerase II transcription subunit 12 isoform X2 [Drosophila nasuta]|uniref:mediator of RNA polymerase II transcription subunit 12 isoform X2 n=1 Tax=Drosophila nasuta TaxID=42062 RepID=UPI00295EA419|nr:mediator of RNA polymerase II transcription subunit 12 isoform X2 [Drosophila nasuta]
MKTLLLLSFLLGLATCEPPVVKGPLVFSSSNWPPKRVQQLGRPAPIAAANSKGGKQRTLVVQIRSDHPVPLVLKGRAGVHSHAHQHVLPHQHVHLPSHSHSHAYLQQSHLHSHSHSPSLPLSHVNLVRGSRPLKLSAPVYLKPSSVGSRKPLKIKLNNSKPHSKPVFGYEKPFRYEKPTANSHTELQHLPKLFAPDPDPSLPTSKVKIATEAFNTPSNNKPLPTDVQISQLPAQPLVQIVGAQAAAQTVPIYPIQLAQQATQPFIAAAVPAAHIPIYNPTYLVTQSNQLYTQHKQQLFKPSTEHVVETGYINADLTQEVASNGQILQAAKDPHHNIHPVLDTAPQYAALIAAPSLGEPSESYYETAPFHLPNNAPAVASSSASEGGFIVSNYYGNAHDSSQLLQAYAEEEGRRQQLETQQAAIELQKQQEQQYHLEELNAQAQAQAQAQTQAQLQQQEQQLQELQRQQYLQEQQQQQQLEFQQTQQDPASSAFEEHQRLVQQQLGSNTPLRIFVPDEETPETRLQKRSDDLNKGTVKDVSHEDDGLRDLIPVSTSVEIAEANSK